MRRFVVAERDVVCSQMMPSGRQALTMNDTHSLRAVPSSGQAVGVAERELPILKVSRSYTYTLFDVGSVVRRHSHDEAQLRVIVGGTFSFVVGNDTFSDLQDGDWLYIPRHTPYSIDCPGGGAVITGYGMSCKCSGGSGRRFLFAERDVHCSKTMPSGKNAMDVNNTDSLRLIPALSAVSGVRKYELPILHESKRNCILQFSAGASIYAQRNEDRRLFMITKGSFDVVADGTSHQSLEERDWIYLPAKSEFSITSSTGGEAVAAYALE